MRRGFTTKETLLALGVLLVAAAVILLVGMTALKRDHESSDADRLQQLYVAATNYAQQYDQVPPPNLTLVRPFAPNETVFLTEHDPYAKDSSSPFPVDAGQPKGLRTSVFRNSFAYLWSYPDAVQAHYKNWSDALMNSELGLIANEWTGKVEPTGDFSAQVSGVVQRVNMDGSVQTTGDRGGPKALGDAEDLFFKH